MRNSTATSWGLVLTLFLAGPVAATDFESEDARGPWNMGFALSFPNETAESSNVVRDGFGLDFILGYQKPDQLIGFRVDMMYTSFKLTDNVVARLDNATEGYYNIFGGGPSVVLSPPVTKWLRPSIYFGPGLYYEHAEATWDEGCDPLSGCPTGGGDYTTTRFNTTRLGWQGGAGLDFLFDNGGAAISLNVQYVQINNTNADMTFIPITIGYKVMF